MQSQRANNATLFSIFVFMFLIGSENFLISPVLPSIATSLGVPITSAAQTVSVYMIVYAIFVPFLGTMSDRFGRQRLISAGAVVFLLGNVLSSGANTLIGLLLARALTSIGAAMAGPSMWAFIGDTTHSSIRGRVMGWVMASFSLGQIMGVPIGAYISNVIGWKYAFCTIGGVTLILCPIIYYQINLYPIRKMMQTDSLLSSSFQVFVNKEICLALLTSLFWAGASFGSFTYLGVFLKTKYGFSISILGYVTGLVGIGSAVGGLVAGKIVDFGRKRKLKESVLLGLWVFLLGAAIFGLTHTYTIWVNLIYLLIWFFASGAFIATQQTMLTLINPNLKARSISWSNSFMYIGTAAGVWVAGQLTQNDQWDLIWCSAFVFSLLGIICTVILSYIRHDEISEVST
ncbi:MAG TPA: MFS transporter [Prolixibacteraceae bacterium]|jgi:DHA1 family inner membrane transport protein